MTSKQLGFLIMGTLVGVNFLTIPRIASEAAGQDAWIAVLVGALLPLLVLVLIERLGRRFPEMDFIQMSQYLFGKIGGSVLVIILSLHMIIVVAREIARFAFLESIFLLPLTPIWAISLLILLVSLYVAGQGAQVVARINELLFYLLLPAFFLIVYPLITAADHTYLLPVGGSGILSIARSSFDVSLYYGRMEFLMVAYFMVTHKDEVLKAGLIAWGAVTVPYMLFTAACLMVFGPENLQEQITPVLAMFTSVSYPLLERMDMLFLVAWSVAFRPVFNLLCMSGYSLTRLLNLQERRHYLMLLTVAGTAAYLFSLIPTSIVELIIYSGWQGYTHPVVGLGYPLLYLLAAKMREGRTQNV